MCIGGSAIHVQRDGFTTFEQLLQRVHTRSVSQRQAIHDVVEVDPHPKTFGQHRLPVGWVIVTAGNPPEYNRSARDFDPAMMDRMKRIDVEPDLGVWMDYATAHGMHPAITTYLASKPKNFYKVRASVNGARMVTARGWEDLSRMIIAYGHEGIGVDGELVSQYLQDAEIAEDFSLYLDLFRKYQDDYKVADILAGAHSPAIAARATAAPFDERIALINLLLDALLTEAHASETAERALEAATDEVDGVRDQLEGKADPMATLSRISAQAAGELEPIPPVGAQATRRGSGLGLGLGPLGGLDLRRTGLEDGLELLAHDGDVGILEGG